ncbi:MAG: UDP-N-acetylglucosamine 1-carboxyvinyltransferase [Firmicutes bacterium]|nr:UDP-N-acetylglucosamine 1-carboxyvinyltransferase [Bacillota bacterium]
MEKLVIRGCRRLQGRVPISGAKNSALAIIPAAALGDGESILYHVPEEEDIHTMCQILQELGIQAWRDQDKALHILPGELKTEAPYELVRRMRASFYVAGLLLARKGEAQVPLPGGCSLGSRPVDFHIRGFQALGAETSIEHGMMIARSPGRLTGTRYFINRSSVGATVNLMLAASLAQGTTILENAAREPEIVDLAIFMNTMGANIRGAGTNVIRIEGVERMKGAQHTILPDRIEAGTYLLAACITQGDITVEDVVPEHLNALLRKLQEAGAEVQEDETTVRVAAPQRLRAVDVETAPYPGFPTDLQQPFVAAMSLAEGTSVIRETIFDRFRYVDELLRMGADIRVERDTAIVRGVIKLTGAPVEATDLRASAALVLAGLAAEGVTEVLGVEHLRRGYEHFEDKFRALGADIHAEPVES